MTVAVVDFERLKIVYYSNMFIHGRFMLSCLRFKLVLLCLGCNLCVLCRAFQMKASSYTSWCLRALALVTELAYQKVSNQRITWKTDCLSLQMAALPGLLVVEKCTDVVWVFTLCFHTFGVLLDFLTNRS